MDQYSSPPPPHPRSDHYQDGASSTGRPITHHYNHHPYSTGHSFYTIWNPAHRQPSTPRPVPTSYNPQQQRRYVYNFHPINNAQVQAQATTNWIRSPVTPQLKSEDDKDDDDKETKSESHNQRRLEFPSSQASSPPFAIASPQQRGTKEEMDEIFALCGADKWSDVLALLQRNPGLSITLITMGNNITTTVLHQAITKRGCKSDRVKVIYHILAITPMAVTIRNGYGSLPLHAIVQRNIGIDASTKESIIRKMVSAYPDSLAEPGGVGKRTPLHILFTDYYSPSLTQEMIHIAPKACFMKDKKGYLPAHVACSRHCSPEKLRMLLHVNPNALFAKTHDNHTLLSLAEGTSTASHPNHSLIEELRRQLELADQGKQPPIPSPPSYPLPVPLSRRRTLDDEGDNTERVTGNDVTGDTPKHSAHDQSVSSPSQQPEIPRKRKRFVKSDVMSSTATTWKTPLGGNNPVDLLLHLSRGTEPTNPVDLNSASNVVEV